MGFERLISQNGNDLKWQHVKCSCSFCLDMSKCFFQIDIFTILYVFGCMQYHISWVSLFHFFLKTHSIVIQFLWSTKWNLSCHWGYVLFRYKENRRILQEGMKKLGFEEFLGPKHDGYIITSYKYPKDPNFNFKTFYSKLNEKGTVY